MKRKLKAKWLAGQLLDLMPAHSLVELGGRLRLAPKWNKALKDRFV
jgi:hypothetical protein